MALLSSDQEKKEVHMPDWVLVPTHDDGALFTSWRIAFFGAILVLVLLPILQPDPYMDVVKFLPGGILRTFQVTVLSILLASLLGLLVGLGRMSHVLLVNRICTIYVEVIRGIPLLVQLFYIYYAMGKFVQLPRMTSAVIAMAFCYGAYMSEVFRAGILSIPKGQMEAALALGLSRAQAMRKVILPQAVKMILPPVCNEFIALLKDSSLVSILAVADLLRAGRNYASVSFNYFETYTIVALVYLVLTLFLSRMVGILEERMGTDERK